MASFLFTKYRSPLVLVAVLLAQIVGLATQMHRPSYASREDGHHVRLARGWTAYTIVPVEKLLVRTGGALRSLWHGYLDLRGIRQHNRDLQYQIDQLRLHETGMLENAREGQRLQRLLGFKQQYVGRTLAAQVIGTGGGDRARILVLNKGSNDGLAPDMAVMTPDGVVGKLRDVSAASSQLLLLNDSSSGAGVLLANVRSRGILRGTAAGRIQIGTLLPDERIKPGEPVVTSGGDGVFPRGLNVGVVESVKLDPEHQPYTSILIKPAANLDRLEEVLVILDTAQELALPPGQAADAGEKRAADVVAERLPSLHETTSASGTEETKSAQEAMQKALADPNKPMPAPRPTPTLHPDRYTPGNMPNAADLQPGGHTAPPAELPKP